MIAPHAKIWCLNGTLSGQMFDQQMSKKLYLIMFFFAKMLLDLWPWKHYNIFLQWIKIWLSDYDWNFHFLPIMSSSKQAGRLMAKSFMIHEKSLNWMHIWTWKISNALFTTSQQQGIPLFTEFINFYNYNYDKTVCYGNPWQVKAYIVFSLIKDYSYHF